MTENRGISLHTFSEIADQALEATKILHGFDFRILKNKNNQAFALSMAQLYADLALLARECDIARFKELGIRTQFHRWFVHLQEIEKEFDKIKKNGIAIDKDKAIRVINSYLTVKIRVEMELWLGYTARYGKDKYRNDIYVSKVLIDYRNLYNSRDRVRRRPKQPTLIYSEIEPLIQEIEELLGDPEKARQWAYSFARGDIEQIHLKELVEQSLFPPEGMSRRHFHCHIYDLIRMLAKDYEDELYATIDEFLPSLLYDGDWNFYRDSRVQHVVFG